MSEPRDPALAQRKLRDAAILLPAAGVILLLPPAATIFALDGTVLGVPLTAAYLFGVWAALIAAARLVGPRLVERETADQARIAAPTETGTGTGTGIDPGTG